MKSDRKHFSSVPESVFSIPEIDTYRDLLAYLLTLSPAQLDQNVMILPAAADGDRPIPLEPAFAIGTVAEMEADTWSSDDRGHHPEQVVILRDLHPFDNDGSIGEDILAGEKIFRR